MATLTVWECCQHLVRLHEKYGIGYEAAVMLKKFGPWADDVPRPGLRALQRICEKRGDARRNGDRHHSADRGLDRPDPRSRHRAADEPQRSDDLRFKG